MKFFVVIFLGIFINCFTQPIWQIANKSFKDCCENGNFTKYDYLKYCNFDFRSIEVINEFIDEMDMEEFDIYHKCFFASKNQTTCCLERGMTEFCANACDATKPLELVSELNECNYEPARLCGQGANLADPEEKK
uniref:Uncharacterized protein n=1 Tax=Panagrolaimus sp. JU765 TaxID=591449 RepID=A0AC34Q134_9BILA